MKPNNMKTIEQKKLLFKLKREIKLLEKRLNDSKIEKGKLFVVKNLKISKKFLQMITPYALASGIVIGGGKLFFNVLPFYPNKTTKQIFTIEEIDNKGNDRIIQQETKISSYIKYYGKWNNDSNKCAKRIVKTFSLNDQDDYDIQALLNSDIDSLEDILGAPIESNIEIKESISENEVNEDELIEAHIYMNDKDGYIKVDMPLANNIAITFSYAVILGFLEFFPYIARRDLSHFDFKKAVKLIKKDYSSFNKEELVKQLEIKKDNYNRLMR